MYRKEDITKIKPALQEYSDKKSAYDEEWRKYNKAQKEVTEATREIWRVFYEAKSKAEEYANIISVFEEYTATCDGDQNMAFKFLQKRFDQETITEAFEWHEIEIPTPLEDKTKENLECTPTI